MVVHRTALLALAVGVLGLCIVVAGWRAVLFGVLGGVVYVVAREVWSRRG